jgi:carbamoyltransferase
MLDWFRVDGITVRGRYGAHGMYRRLRDVLWAFPSEQFAYMAQRTLELRVVELVRNVVRELHVDRVALAGGVFANILVNRLIRLLPEVRGCFVFPHMGDGGLALGAAIALNLRCHRVARYLFEDVYLGPAYDAEAIGSAARSAGVQTQRIPNPVQTVADLILAGRIGLWFQGRMEYGPRALGARSILAVPGSEKVKNELNLRLKRRVWYQPFCPSMLESAAVQVFEDYRHQPDPFMTNAYVVKEEHRERLRAVIHIDGTCRPQILGPCSPAAPYYRELLEEIERRTGLGVVLNTSFNLHGEPLVCSPQDALRTFQETGADYLVMGDLLVLRPSVTLP